MEKKEVQKKRMRRTVIFDTDTGEKLGKIALEKNSSIAEVIRGLVEKGLVADGYKEDDERLYKMIHTAVSEITKPQVERLAALNAKAASMTAQSFFLNVLVLESNYDDEAAGEWIQAVIKKAKQLAGEYLKSTGVSTAEFSGRAMEKLRQEIIE